MKVSGWGNGNRGTFPIIRGMGKTCGSFKFGILKGTPRKEQTITALAHANITIAQPWKICCAISAKPEVRKQFETRHSSQFYFLKKRQLGRELEMTWVYITPLNFVVSTIERSMLSSHTPQHESATQTL